MSFKVKSETSVSLSDLVLPDGVNVAKRLEEIHDDILSIGQSLCLIRQGVKVEVEDLECRCWKLLDWIEDMK